VKICKLK